MIKILFIISFLFATTLNFAQIDSLQASKSDTLKPAKSDSLKTSKKSGAFDVTSIIYSSASDSLIFNIKKKKMFLYGKSKLKYKDTELQSGKIAVNFVTNELDAKGIIDTADTTGKKFVQTPVFTEGGNTFEGRIIKYNFKTKKGYISLAKNKKQESRYEGKVVKKVSKNVYFIKNGIYTTCPSDTPNTYFTAKEMKVIQKDKIIAKWIFMYIGGVPLPIPLPFAVFPTQTGRRSGLIAPGYGWKNRAGFYFSHFGYFFAINDYMDLALTGTYYTNGGWGMRERFRYAKRYNYSGNLSGGISKIIYGENGDPNRAVETDWNFGLFHNQRFTPTTSLDLNLQFQSSNYYHNNSINMNNLLAKNILSRATFQKRWDESGNNLTISYSRTQNLSSGDIYETLPDITFNKSLSFPFRKRGAVNTKDMKWYELIGYRYTGEFRNNRQKINRQLKIRGGLRHYLTISASPKIWHFNISPSLNYTEKWYNKRIVKTSYLEQIDSTHYQEKVLVRDVHKIGIVRTFNFSLSASTKLYGMAHPDIFGIAAFRHTVTPSISYIYHPDFTNPKWGYYGTYINSEGKKVKYDKYQREIFGGAGGGESQFISLNVGNLFEIKTEKNPTDTTSKEKKIRLLNLNFGIGYDFTADSLNLSNLNVSYRTQIGDYLNFFGSSSYTFYDYNGTNKINRYLISSGKGLFRLTNFSLSLSSSLSGKKLKGKNKKSRSDTTYKAFKKEDYISLYNQVPPDFSIPWNLSLNLNYNISKPTPSFVYKSASIGMSLDFNLTKNWKISVRGNYDLINKLIIAPQISVYRDLKCWEMHFNWYPTGFYRGFRFEIRMKAPQLRDVKLTKTKGLFSGKR